jgi:hypothetical protein
MWKLRLQNPIFRACPFLSIILLFTCAGMSFYMMESSIMDVLTRFELERINQEL